MRSVERRLLVWILGALSVGAVALVLVSYLVTLEEMDEIFDENLKQVALAVATYHGIDVAGVAPRSRHELPVLPRVYEEADDFDFVTVVWDRDGRRSVVSNPAVELPFGDVGGLARVRSRDEDWHVYTIVGSDSVIQAAQRASSRKTLAGAVASKLFAPLFVLIGLIGVLLVAALRRGLRPLDAAAADVAKRSAVSLEPIDEAPLPREIHPLIRAINGLMQRLSDAFSAQRRFVADAAHELRSPITALRLQLQTFERSRDEEARLRATTALKAGIERAQRLVEQLLSLSRVEPDAPAATPLLLDLGELAREAVSLRSIEAEQKGIDLGAEVTAAATVPADRQQLMVLLDNLIGNAIRYTPAGGIVDVRAGRLDGRPALHVLDNGPGIPPDERERVFDRFYRGEGLQSDVRLSGSGLGLAIVKAIAQRNRAIVSLHDRSAGGGLEVRVVFGD